MLQLAGSDRFGGLQAGLRGCRVRILWTRPEAMPTIAALLDFRETWLTLLFGVAMVPLRLRMQGCAVAGMFVSESTTCCGGRAPRHSAVGKTNWEGTIWMSILASAEVAVVLQRVWEGCAPGCVASCVFAKMCIQSYLSENEARHLFCSTPVGGALGTKLRQARCNTC